MRRGNFLARRLFRLARNFCSAWTGREEALINSAIVRRPVGIVVKMARRVTSGLNVSLSSRLVSPARGRGPVIKAGKQNYSEIRVRAPWPRARSSNWPIFAVIDHQLPEIRDILITWRHETERRTTAKLSASSLSVYVGIISRVSCARQDAL